MISKEDMRRWGGKDVFDPEGEKIGTIEDFYLDKSTYEPDWVIVKRGFLGGSSKLVPYIAIDWLDDHVVACYDKHTVEESPGPGMDGRLSDEEEWELMEHYGLARSRNGGLIGMRGQSGEYSETESVMTPDEPVITQDEPGATHHEMDESERRRMAEQAAAAHPFSAGLEDEDRDRGFEEQASEQAGQRPESEEFLGEEVAGSGRLVRVKRYMVTERVEQVPISDEEFEEGDEAGGRRHAA